MTLMFSRSGSPPAKKRPGHLLRYHLEPTSELTDINERMLGPAKAHNDARSRHCTVLDLSLDIEAVKRRVIMVKEFPQPFLVASVAFVLASASFC